MRTAWEWYGVKTLHRVAASGRPTATDKDYSPTMTLVEERVVIVKARSFKEAIQRAELEAKAYSRLCRHRNRYGQQVRSRYLGYCDAYLCDDGPKHGTEVYSSTEVVSRRVPDRAIISRLIGKSESKRVSRTRSNICDIVFSAPAPGVRLTRAEEAFVVRYGTLKRRA